MTKIMRSSIITPKTSRSDSLKYIYMSFNHIIYTQSSRRIIYFPKREQP